MLKTYFIESFIIVILLLTFISGCGSDSPSPVIPTATISIATSTPGITPTVTPVPAVISSIEANTLTTMPALSNGATLSFTADKNCRANFGGDTSGIKTTCILNATTCGCVYSLSFCSELTLTKLAISLPVTEGNADALAYTKDNGTTWTLDGNISGQSVTAIIPTLKGQYIYFVAVKKTGGIPSASERL